MVRAPESCVLSFITGHAAHSDNGEPMRRLTTAESLVPADLIDPQDMRPMIMPFPADLHGKVEVIAPVLPGTDYGTPGYHVIKGSQGADTIYGTDEADAIYALAGNDTVFGGDGDDRIAGGSGADRLFGDYGDDLLDGGSGADRLDGGEGIDTVSYIDAVGSGVTVRLGRGGIDPTNDATVGGGFGGDAQSDILIGIENVRGTMFADRIIGDGGANLLNGDHGDDEIIGWGGEDRLIGGSGRDTLTGDGDGSVAADVFVLGGPHMGRDFITDFQQGVDKLEMNVYGAAFGDDGVLAWGTVDANGAHVHAMDDSDNYFFDINTHTLHRASYSGATGELHFLGSIVTVNQDVLLLQANDFVLV